jgi:peptidoglycan/LPS O-acetylase OafA/YrhL
LDSGWRLGHRPSLDGLRGIAVLLVLLGHVDNPIMGGQGAYVGVGVFFSLSGFLITGLLLDEWANRDRIDLAAFYVRRARRLLPALAVFTLACLATGVVALAALPAVALYFANWAWILGVDLGAMAHTWSLGVEEQFYILWPSLLGIMLLRGLRAAWWTAIAGALISMVLILLVAGAGADGNRILAGSDGRVASLLLGAAVAIAAHRTGRIPWSAPLAACVGAGVLVALAEAPLTALAIPLTALAAMPVIAWAAANPTALSWRWLTGTGRISYAMYLWHYPFAYGFWPVTRGLPWPLALLVVTALTYALAAASWVVVERRFLRVRRGIPGSPLPTPS